jgi:hypothetical protein
MSEKTNIRILKKGKHPKKGERDAMPRGKANGATGHWLGPESQKWTILVGLSVIISILLFPNVLTQPRIYQLGDVADRDIKASRELLIENNELTDQNRQDAVKNVLSVYDFDPTGTHIVSRINEAFSEGRRVLSVAANAEASPAGQPPETAGLRDGFFEILDLTPDENIINPLLKAEFPKQAEDAVIALVSQVLKKGIVMDRKMLEHRSASGISLHNMQTGQALEVKDLNRFHDVQTARSVMENEYESLERTLKSSDLADASMLLATALIKPNVTFNKRETEIRKDVARKAVKPFYFKIKRGEMIVREGERITPEHLLKLSEENKTRKPMEMISRVPAMTLLFGFLLAVLYFVGLLTDRSSKTETKNLLFNAVTLLVIFLTVLITNFVAEELARGYRFFTPHSILFAAPVASGAMLVSVFQGMRLAASFSLIVSVLAAFAVGGGVEFFVYFFVSSLVAGYGVKNCRERGIFVKAGLKVSLTNMVMALAILAVHGSFYSLDTLIASTSALLGGILVGVIATGILPLFEMSFGFTTDIKLLELASLDQPLLRELMVQAPGTYHHSVIVSNMVEATAKAVNANPLLAKVAAYYHDIGKMRKPLYFIENQRVNENRHEKLAPSMSSLVLISHVKDGVELAKKEKLGSEIIDIIQQHHGTSFISFFYQKAKEHAQKKGAKAAQVKEEDFRYPGPKPQTKEAGLVMLADVVEAASKTLVDPTAARIQGMVQKIIRKVFSDGQLDECELTLKDLNEIARSFNKTLSGIFHHRIEYPGSVTKTASTKKAANGNTDQLSGGDTRTQKSDNKIEAGENLKRLGLS